MPSNTAGSNTDGGVDSKVARLIDSYRLGEEFGERLEELWTAEGEERESLRSLADRFNRRLLEAAMTEAGMSPVEGEVDNLYRLLTSDEVSSGNRTEARGRLEQNGIDIDQLERNFVTYQAIRSYLMEYRGATYDHENGKTRIKTVINTIQRLKSRIRTIAEKSINQLENTNQISSGEYRLFIDIDVVCEECKSQYELVELLRAGGCDCQSD